MITYEERQAPKIDLVVDVFLSDGIGEVFTTIAEVKQSLEAE